MIKKIAEEFTQMTGSFTIESQIILMVLGAILIIFETGTFNMLTYGHWGLEYPIFAPSILKHDGQPETE
tara:strand:- start:95 stop:301 length:207 start_codon:yes stop_codon:yes gene_type:complete